jgi:hypothetical protein
MVQTTDSIFTFATHRKLFSKEYQDIGAKLRFLPQDNHHILCSLIFQYCETLPKPVNNRGKTRDSSGTSPEEPRPPVAGKNPINPLGPPQLPGYAPYP